MVHYRSDGSWGWLDHSQCRDEIEVIAGDVRDRDSVAKVVKNIDVVFHLAALIAIPYSYNAPLSYVHTNIEGTVNVLQSARQEGAERVIHTSTSEVYGTARYVPIDEEHPLQGQSPYSASKIGADKLAEAFHLSFGLPITIVRPFNAYGPRQSARAVIPTIISQALSETEIRLGDLSPTRDFNYVSDIADGFILAAECGEAVGQTINIGSGTEISIGDLAATILRLVGKEDIPITQSEDRVRPPQSEVKRLLADNRKALEILGWSPHYALNDGLGLTIEWIRNNIDMYRVGTYAI